MGGASLYLYLYFVLAFLVVAVFGMGLVLYRIGKKREKPVVVRPLTISRDEHE